MKRVVLLFISLIVFTTSVYSKEVEKPVLEKKEVKLVNCQSSTTAWYEIDSRIKIIRLLAYDPEDGNLNSIIDEYACNLLENANKIEIEYDLKALETDKYNRDLAWVFVDGKLLQDILIQKGYGQVNYVNAEYQNLNILCESEKIALTDKLGIWNYSNIKEKYCKSGIDINNTETEENKALDEDKNYDIRNLYYLLFIDSGIVLLLLLLIKR